MLPASIVLDSPLSARTSEQREPLQSLARGEGAPATVAVSVAAALAAGLRPGREGGEEKMARGRHPTCPASARPPHLIHVLLLLPRLFPLRLLPRGMGAVWVPSLALKGGSTIQLGAA